MGKGGLACAAPFPKSCAQIGAQDSGCFFYNRSDQQNFKITKFIVDYYMSPTNVGSSIRQPYPTACMLTNCARLNAACMRARCARMGIIIMTMRIKTSYWRDWYLQGREHTDMLCV